MSIRRRFYLEIEGMTVRFSGYAVLIRILPGPSARRPKVYDYGKSDRCHARAGG
jgi:hypothetical protein